MPAAPRNKEQDQKSPNALNEALRRGDFAAARKMLASHVPPPASKQPAPAPAPQATMTLAETCGAGQTNLDGHKFTRIRRSARDYLPDEPAALRYCASVLRGARQRLDELEASKAMCHAASVNAEDFLFVTAETLEPPEASVFLVSVMFVESGDLVIEQYITGRDGEEKGVLKAFASRYGAASVVVTFAAGRKSLIKTLLARCSACGVDPSAEAWEAPQRSTGNEGPIHLDLRKECRNRWGRLGGRLASAERKLLDRSRNIKLPRKDMAAAYRDYLVTANALRVGDMLLHAAMDMLSMAQLLCHLLTGWDREDGY